MSQQRISGRKSLLHKAHTRTCPSHRHLYTVNMPMSTAFVFLAAFLEENRTSSSVTVASLHGLNPRHLDSIYNFVGNSSTTTVYRNFFNATNINLFSRIGEGHRHEVQYRMESPTLLRDWIINIFATGRITAQRTSSGQRAPPTRYGRDKYNQVGITRRHRIEQPSHPHPRQRGRQRQRSPPITNLSSTLIYHQ